MEETRSERLLAFQTRYETREREVGELEARHAARGAPPDAAVADKGAGGGAPLADVGSSYENLANVLAVKVRPPSRHAGSNPVARRRRTTSFAGASTRSRRTGSSSSGERRPRLRRPRPRR